MSSLFDAVVQNNVELVKELIQDGRLVNQLVEGESALHVAAQYPESKDVLKYLLSKPEINVDIRNLNGYTPLTTAVRFKDPDAAILLITKGACVNSKDNNGFSVLDSHMMTESGVKDELMQYILTFFGAERGKLEQSWYDEKEVVFGTQSKRQKHRSAQCILNSAVYCRYDELQRAIVRWAVWRGDWIEAPWLSSVVFREILTITRNMPEDNYFLQDVYENFTSIPKGNLLLLLKHFPRLMVKLARKYCLITEYFRHFSSCRHLGSCQHCTSVRHCSSCHFDDYVGCLEVLIHSNISQILLSKIMSQRIKCCVSCRYAQKKGDKDALLAMIRLCWQIGMPFTTADTLIILYYFGECDFFRELLHSPRTEYKKLANHHRDFPILFELRYDMSIKVQDIDTMISRRYFRRGTDLLHGYTAEPRIKLVVGSEAGRDKRDHVTRCLSQLPQIPSLQELTRNALRDSLIDRHQIKTYKQFSDLMAKMDIPRKDVFDYLISRRGVDLNIRGVEGFSPLTCAVTYRNTDAAIKLILRGAYVNHVDDGFYSILDSHMMALKGVVDDLLLQLLIYYGAQRATGLIVWPEFETFSQIYKKSKHRAAQMILESAIFHHYDEIQRAMVTEAVWADDKIASAWLSSTVFGEIVKITQNMPVDDDFLADVFEYMMCIPLSNLRTLVRNFPTFMLKLARKYCLITEYLRTLPFYQNVDDGINCLRLLLRSPISRAMVAQKTRKKYQCCLVCHHAEKFMEHVRGGDEEALLTMFRLCWQRGVPFTTADALVVYVHYGPCDFFKELIRSPRTKYERLANHHSNLSMLAVLRYDMTVKVQDISTWLDLGYFGRTFDLLGGYVSESSVCMSVVKRAIGPAAVDRVAKYLHQLPQVPSLQELARNVLRDSLIDQHEIKTYRQFTNMMRTMKLPRHVANILLFQTKLYDVHC